MFDNGTTVDAYYRSHAESVVNQIANLHDKICESQDEEYTIRQLLQQHVGSSQPILEWEAFTQIGVETIDNVVTIDYGIPLRGDRYDIKGLYLGVPHTFTDKPSRFVRFWESCRGSQPILVVEFRVPLSLWHQNGESWFVSVRDGDLRWLKTVVDVYRREESKHNNALVELIHRGVSERYKLVRNVDLALSALPPPTDLVDSDQKRPREFRDPRYRVHKRHWFGQQEGKCNGCQRNFHFDQMTVDHITPQSKGGSHEFDNLQLLCEPCATLKADNTMDDLFAALGRQGT